MTQQNPPSSPVQPEVHSSHDLITVDHLSVGFQSTVVLKEVSLSIPRRGILLLLGPAGAGKSTLLRTLGRWNEHQPAFWCHGHIWLQGDDLLQQPVVEAQRKVAMLAQKARLYTASIIENALAEVRDDRPLSLADKRELAHSVLQPHGLWEEFSPLLGRPVTSLSIARQRMLAIARLTSGGARCVLCDEPFRDITEEERPELQDFIARLSEKLAVVLITHDQKIARSLGTEVCLLSGRRVAESSPAEEFFSSPRTPLGRSFIRTGNAWPDEPSIPPPPGELPTWAPTEEEAGIRPGSFHWIIKDRLGGMQMPGLLNEVEDDLAGLRSLGVKLLVTLTEKAFDSTRLGSYGIEAHHVPIVDMDVPSLAAASHLCALLSDHMDRQRAAVLHCKAGLGRTGTLLACVLVFRGDNAVSAVHRVRTVNPLYIQSERQLSFITEFQRYLRG